MNGVALAARLVLAGVFAVAGAAKLRDGAGTRSTLEDFGLPAALVAPGALLLPLAELTVAGLLLFDPTAVAGAVGALVLLGAFMVGITVNLAQGRRPDCNCFGQLHSKPVGPGHARPQRDAGDRGRPGARLRPHRRRGGGASTIWANLDTATALAAGALALSALTLALVGWIATAPPAPAGPGAAAAGRAGRRRRADAPHPRRPGSRWEHPRRPSSWPACAATV